MILSGLLGTLPSPLQPETTFPSTLHTKTTLLGLLGMLPSSLQPETTFPSTLHTKTELGPGG